MSIIGVSSVLLENAKVQRQRSQRPGRRKADYPRAGLTAPVGSPSWFDDLKQRMAGEGREMID
jgi:hypothetical protein